MPTLPRIYSIQALRAVAAVLVVIYHARGLAFVYQERYGTGQTLFFDFAFLREIGAFGVDIFFVISGFIMTYITWHEPRDTSSIWPFLKRRLARIVPSYWLYTLVMMTALFLTSEQFVQQTGISDIIYSLLFIPYQPTEGTLSPILAVGWTLSYEMYFYILVAIGLLWPRRIFLVGLGVYFFLSVSAPLFFTPTLATFSTMTNLLVLEFYFGMLICVAYVHFGGFGKKAGWAALIFSGIMIAGWFQFTPSLTYRGLVWGLPAAGIVVWFLSRESATGFFARPLWQALGASSYSLYLTHVIILPVLARIGGATRLLPHVPMDVYLVIVVTISIVAAHILYLFVEKPLSRFASALLSGRAKRMADVPRA